ncbi:MAG: hypothetical protein ABW213_09560 [Tardiphaga sp.]
MSIAAIPRVTPTTPPQMRRAGDIGVERTVAAPSVESVAVVGTEQPLRSAPVSSQIARPDAAFLIHLIATAEQAPQTRVLRRADVGDVIAAYRAAGQLTAPNYLKRTA